MIDFATLQGLTIPEGVVTQIKDAAGNVLWELSGGNVILEVEKITSDTYAAETTYTGEQFILLDIAPKTNGTVTVTYGGLTKTITDTSGAAEPNGQSVFFGTFNGVSDSVTTPASGRLTIEGDVAWFGCGIYYVEKLKGRPCICVIEIKSFGGVVSIPMGAFGDIFNGVSYGCAKITDVSIPDTITTIGKAAFNGTGLTSAVFAATSGWYVTETEDGTASTGIPVDVTDPASNAIMLTDTYLNYYWHRS